MARPWLCPRPPAPLPLAFAAGLCVSSQLLIALSRTQGLALAVALSLAYGLGAGGIFWACLSWAEGWTGRWSFRPRPAARSRQMPGFSGLAILVLAVTLGAAAPLMVLMGLGRSVGVMWGALFLVYACLLMTHKKMGEGTLRLLEAARDQSLRARLAPHFLFNTLNSLKAQIEKDPLTAVRTVDRLASLFRQVVDSADRPTVTLREELAFVEAFLGIERARMGDRLQVEVDVPEDLDELELPPFSLQVLVENAVKHGVAPLESGGRVVIRARREGADLVLSVEDPGRGPGQCTPGTGTALETLRQRLARPGDLDMGMVDGHHRVTFRWPA